MEQENTKTDEKKRKERKVILFLWIIPMLLLFPLVGLLAIAVYFFPDGSSTDIEISQVIGLITIVVIIAALSLLITVWRLYSSVRYIQLPVWRWIVSGFKGEPKLPFPRFSWATKSARAEAKSKMNKKQRACIWLGNICSFVGMILIINRVAWRWILTIKGESIIDSVSLTLFWVGIFMFFTGICVSGLVYQRILKTQPLQNKQDE